MAVPGDLLHMDSSRYARFERPGHRVTGDRSRRSRNWMSDGTRVGYDYATRSSTTTRDWPNVELHPDEKAATVTAYVERALAWFEQHGIQAKRLMNRQRLELHPQQLATRAAPRSRNQTPAHPGLPATNQREGRALPPNNGQRVGLRHELPLKPPPRPSPATLARALQPAQTTQRDRQPATHQPRSQPTWAGQLGSHERVCAPNACASQCECEWMSITES